MLCYSGEAQALSGPEVATGPEVPSLSLEILGKERSLLQGD